ncbi:DUF1292 domain-containing protein [Paenibacillus nasutitermitis]|uniref:DUF1292 domain-containing protein n=1 Tax=Paenibacillus nasutitermitis TaxID=1652958 RepID=A0A916YP59_9BACL|nr:DUF1292 domain-containing protein [Paenibacillus nasutitermitis]GGD55080.1 hypothetical protein GCM10010911_10900 [Paenibacillus nasutitermitis]
MSTVERISVLRTAFGQEVELIGEDGQTELLRVVAEFRLGASDYAGLQSEAMRKSDEVAFFRVLTSGSEPTLESIEDEDEWEAVAEAFDDLWFDGDQQP